MFGLEMMGDVVFAFTRIKDNPTWWANLKFAEPKEIILYRRYHAILLLEA